MYIHLVEICNYKHYGLVSWASYLSEGFDEGENVGDVIIMTISILVIQGSWPDVEIPDPSK